MRNLVIGNWKMNPDSLAEAKRIVRDTRKITLELKHTTVVACPPFVYGPLVLSTRMVKTGPVALGAQDVHTEERGSFTGEVSAMSLREVGVSHVIVGHSERRAMGETNEVVSKKAQAVVEAGMTAIVCVGEATHDAQGAYLEPLKEQIKASLALVPKKYVKHLVMAYEPIWAIGAKDAMDPSVVQEMAIFVRKVLSDIYSQEDAVHIPVLYGGSVNFRNAGDIMTKGGVDGLLVGRESVNAPGFVELLKVVDQTPKK